MHEPTTPPVLADTVRSLRWVWVLLANVTVGAAVLLFIHLSVFAYVDFYSIIGWDQPSIEHLTRVVELVGTWGVRTAFLAASAYAALAATKKAGELPFSHGIAVGVGAALVSWIVVNYQYPPWELPELVWFLALGVAGGSLGGAWARVILTKQEALLRASEAIGGARNQEAVATAIGEHLGGPNIVGVYLWRAVKSIDETNGSALRHRQDNQPSKAAVFELEASWASPTREVWHMGPQLDVSSVPALASLLHPVRAKKPLDVRPTMLRFEELPAEISLGIVVGQQRQARAVLVLPLLVPSTARAGLLMVALRSRRWRLPRSIEREYLTVGTQAITQLENLSLIEEARLAAVHGERRRVGHELHDGLAQGLTSIVTLTEAAPAGSRDVAGNEESEALWLLRRVGEVAREHLGEVRRVVLDLRPSALQALGLAEALKHLAQKWSEEAGLEAHAEIVGETRNLPADGEDILYSAAREALTNVRKHARGARRAKLTLSYVEDLVVLDVCDDGAGSGTELLDRPPTYRKPVTNLLKSGGLGLEAMREQVEEYGGVFSIDSTPGKGTMLTVELPISDPGRPDECEEDSS